MDNVEKAVNAFNTHIVNNTIVAVKAIIDVYTDKRGRIKADTLKGAIDRLLLQEEEQE